MKGMGNMMKQAQKLQARMMKVQQELAERTVDATAGGGMVKVTVNGAQPPQVTAIEIEAEVVDPEDVDMLQALVLAAVNDGIKKSQEMVSQEMQKVAGGLGVNLPGLF